MAESKAPRRRRKSAHGGVPNVHFLMIVATLVVIIVGYVGHLIQPEDRLGEWMVLGGLGAMFGKFTNGFGAKLGDMLAPRLFPMPEEPEQEEAVADAA